MQFHQSAPRPGPLPYSAVAFRRYVTDYNLELLEVALKSGVRYSTVWCIWKRVPIKGEHELLIRQGMLRMTGIPYTAPMLVHTGSEQAHG